MIKSIVVIVVAALLVVVASAEETSEGEKCLEESADFMSKVPVDEDVRKLVNVSRRFYRNLGALFAPYGKWSDSWVKAVREAGYQRGCQQLEAGEKLIRGCIAKFIQSGEDLMIKDKRFDPETETLFEASIACANSYEKSEEQCLEESADFMSKLPVDEDVRKLVDVSHKFVTDIELLHQLDSNLLHSWNVELLKAGYPVGCSKVHRGTDLILYGFLRESNDPDAFATVGLSKPKAKKVFEAFMVCTYSKFNLTQYEIDTNISQVALEDESEDECQEKSVDELSKMPLDESVNQLVRVSRRFYPKLENLFKIPADMPTVEKYKEGMKEVNVNVLRCGEIIDAVMKIWVTCLAEVVGDDAMGLVKIAQSSPETDATIRAYYACLDVTPQKSQLEESTDFMSEGPVDEDVMS